MTTLRFGVSDRLVEVTVEGGPLTKGELEILNEYLAIQEQIAPTERREEPDRTASPKEKAMTIQKLIDAGKRHREELRAVIMMYSTELTRVELAIREGEDRLRLQIQRDVERWAHPLPGDLTDDQLEFEQECADARYTMLDAENDRDMGEIAIESEQENTE